MADKKRGRYFNHYYSKPPDFTSVMEGIPYLQQEEEKHRKRELENEKKTEPNESGAKRKLEEVDKKPVTENNNPVKESNKKVLEYEDWSLEDDKQKTTFMDYVGDQYNGIMKTMEKIVDVRNQVNESLKQEITRFKSSNMTIPINHYTMHPSVYFSEEFIEQSKRYSDLFDPFAYMKFTCNKLEYNFDKYVAYLTHLSIYNTIENDFVQYKVGDMNDSRILIKCTPGKLVRSFEIDSRLFCSSIQILSDAAEKRLFSSFQEAKTQITSVSKSNDLKNGLCKTVIFKFPLDDNQACFFGMIGRAVFPLRESVAEAKTLYWRDDITSKFDTPDSEEHHQRAISILTTEFVWFTYYYFFCDCSF